MSRYKLVEFEDDEDLVKQLNRYKAVSYEIRENPRDQTKDYDDAILHVGRPIETYSIKGTVLIKIGDK